MHCHLGEKCQKIQSATLKAITVKDGINYLEKRSIFRYGVHLRNAIFPSSAKASRHAYEHRPFPEYPRKISKYAQISLI